MLYPKNKTEKLEKELFQNPTSEYRGTPFWAWNCKLNKETLKEQIEYLKEMGFGGFHIHSRTGMATEYLSDEFMGLVKECVDKAKQENMLVWLYDEDRWPSGAAGGFVTREPKYRQRYLCFRADEIECALDFSNAIAQGKPYLLACYDIILGDKGELLVYKQISPDEKASGLKRYAYICVPESSPWYNNFTYVDTLCKEAMDKFISVTHERYKEVVGNEFGKTVRAIFSDEPQFYGKETFEYPMDESGAKMPWTPKLPELFYEKYGYDIVKRLPEIAWDLSDGQISQVRYHFHDFTTQLFNEAFTDACGKWCRDNGLGFTGHMMGEEDLWWQTRYTGDTMRAYKAFQIPGIDILCGRMQFTTAKQAQSVVHQYGKEAMLSELYGVTNWHFDFRGHKFQGDWQAALGVSVRVPHLSWVSMEREAKRDYPASINFQSPWYREYPYVENHFARINTALTRGKSAANVAVIHPIESYWLYFGTLANTSDICNELNTNFKNLTRWLIEGLIDFDFVSEALLPEQIGKTDGKTFHVGQMSYDAVLVADCKTMRSSTLDALKEFVEKGGRVIFAGSCPQYIDAVLSPSCIELSDRCINTAFGKTEILKALEECRMVDITNSNGERTDNLLYSMRIDNDCRWIFIAHMKQSDCIDVVHRQDVEISIKGKYKPILYDTVTGEISDMAYCINGDKTFVKHSLYSLDSLLIKLEPTEVPFLELSTEKYRIRSKFRFADKVSYQRSEPNVLILDMARWRLDDGEWNEEDEVLRLDNRCREILNFPLRTDKFAQPWAVPEEKAEHFITLQYTIRSEMDYENANLAIENPEQSEMTFNGIHLSNVPIGYYVDKAIKTVMLPCIKKGENILNVRFPITQRAGAECCYILGEFNVCSEGRQNTIVPMKDKIAFGDITRQGLPFYGGNITYKAEFEVKGGETIIAVSRYRGSVVEISVDGRKMGYIAYEPYRLNLGNLSRGIHTVEITLYGNRYNTFGAIHNAEYNQDWSGPNYWRTVDEGWSYEYILKETGILTSPVIEFVEGNYND